MSKEKKQQLERWQGGRIQRWSVSVDVQEERSHDGAISQEVYSSDWPDWQLEDMGSSFPATLDSLCDLG